MASVATRKSTSPDWKEPDLGVAGAGRERPHHHRGPAAVPADQFGDGVDRVGRERDDGAAPGQAGQLLRAGVAQGRQPLAELDLRPGAEAPDQRDHGRGAEQHRLGKAACVQQAVGEDVPALRIGAKLDFVDGQEFDLAVERHRLDRADEILRMGRDDLLLAGDQGDALGAARLHDSVINLPREQPQRQADHAGRMGQHALDRKMGLAGVGRTENGDQTRAL